ncbi:glycoside hydrolase family 108 protein [Burkholderia sp. Bp9142]|uniref:glycoside hydrolase family 108 protein n=1 Tax=Burkholderia sp. Bp9142 TaxID=2184573 RepID=UPI000F5B799F|nr:glycosyl hydrolase 108 family protein [Burkholderia sp. Bp9142]RQR37863.1 hypothetical protein DIE22_10230 [Burkholderia sp. Bp9142]
MDLKGKVDALLGREGGFSNDPNDKGNWYLGKLEGTMWGITAAVARSFGYTGPMNMMPRDTAVSIYQQRYWFGVKFDQIAAIDDRLAERLFDIGVNAGQATGVQFLQRALNTLNHGGKDFPDLSVDGGVGAVTLGALKGFVAQRGQQGRDVLFFMVASLHSVFYVVAAENRPANEDFEFGWQVNRAMNGVRV